MNLLGASIFIALLACTVASATAQTKPKAGDQESGSTGIVGPSMTPTPTLTPKQKPQSPTQATSDGSVRGTKLPPMVTYEAMLQKVRGTLPARLGAWSCAGTTCTLKGTGDANRSKAVDACKSFTLLAKQQGLRYQLYKFRINATTSLSEAELRNCLS